MATATLTRPAEPTEPAGSAATAATATARGARGAGRVRWTHELGLIAVLSAVYMLARAAIGIHVDEAHARGQRILDIESWLHLDLELPLNQLVSALPLVGLLFAYAYATLHYVVTPLVLSWIAVRRAPSYRLARNALLLATVIGLVGYWLLPTAPPRMLGSEWVDTMSQFSGVGWWGEAASAPRGMEGFSNQYAAFPSLHVGWAMWVALCLRRMSRSAWVARWAWTYPAFMTVVVMGTANHYLVDALAGIACAVIGFRLAQRWSDRRSGEVRTSELDDLRREDLHRVA